jgi:hypothetical protein
MPQIILTKPRLREFADFLSEHQVGRWFLAKDDGAYIGATNGKKHDDPAFARKLFYFAGCNPNTDDDYYDTARDKFGGDDFGEFFEPSIIYKLAGNPKVLQMILKVNKASITIDSRETK